MYLKDFDGRRDRDVGTFEYVIFFKIDDLSIVYHIPGWDVILEKIQNVSFFVR